MRPPARISISSARRGSVPFGRSATGPDRTSSATARARSALTGAGPGATDFFSASSPPVMKALRQNRTVSSRTPKAWAIWPLVQPDRVSKIARGRSGSPRSREWLRATSADLCSASAIKGLALVGFRGGGAVSRNQACDKGAEQGSPTPARVGDELEEAEIERQLVLRDAPVRAEPGAQQRPEPFHGVDVHLAEAVTIFVAGILTPGMADRLVLIAPVLQAGVDAILVGVDEGALSDGARDDRL